MTVGAWTIDYLEQNLAFFTIYFSVAHPTINNTFIPAEILGSKVNPAEVRQGTSNLISKKIRTLFLRADLTIADNLLIHEMITWVLTRQIILLHGMRPLES